MENTDRDRETESETDRGRKGERDRQMKKLFSSKCKNHFCKNEQTASILGLFLNSSLE